MPMIDPGVVAMIGLWRSAHRREAVVVNQTAVAAALGLSMPWSLSDKAQFPKPTSNDGARNVCGTSSTSSPSNHS